LSQLSPQVLKDLSLQPVDLNVSAVIYEPNQPIQYAYFPEQGVLSVVSVLKNGCSIEVGTVGREGMVGSILLLQTESSPYRHFVQVAGHGHRIGAGRLKEVAQTSDEFRDVILRYEGTFRTQTMQGMA